MTIDKYENAVVEEISSLFKQYGYKRYKLGCFEEYSLYQENKDFLLSKNVIAFSDLSGRLMAMRPDVTLSVIRHNEVNSTSCRKFFYNEKVYRQSAGSRDYKEINQTGVEVVGAIDEATVTECALLALKTLAVLGDEYVIDLSHVGFTEGLLDEFGGDREILLKYLISKNLHDFYILAEKRGYHEKLVKAFNVAVDCGGNAEEVLEKAQDVLLNGQMQSALSELNALYSRLKDLGYGDKVNVDFSATGNADYYNGVIFNGYINGIPHRVLSGGRYDKLLSKLGKEGSAIGFALYLGDIERYFKKDDERVDALIIYDNATQDRALKLSDSLIKEGKSVLISCQADCEVKYSQLIDLRVKE